MIFTFILNNASFFIFVLFMTAFLIYKRKKVEVQGSFPIMYMILYKTRFGLDKMDSWSKNRPKVFLYLAYLSIIIGILGIFASVAMMIWGLDYTITNNLGSGGGLVLPLKTDAGMDGSVPIFYVPFWYWIIALFILVIVHEFAHGVIAERFKIKVKSSGFAFGALLFPILPAAFVEPDEKSLSKAKWWEKIAVFGAGSTSNFLFGFLFLFIWIFAAAPMIDNTMTFGDIKFGSVMNKSSLTNYDITSGQIIALNGEENKELIFTNLMNLSVNESINLTINNSDGINTYNILTFENPQKENKGMIGISNLQTSFTNKADYTWIGNFPLYFEKLFYYLWMLNIGIGIMNLLPLWITDGGQITRTLLEQKFKRKMAMKLYNWISLFSLLLIIFTIWPSTLISLINLF